MVHWKPRPDPFSFFRQYYRYAVGDGTALLSPRYYLRKFFACVLGWGLVLSGKITLLLLLAALYLAVMMGRYWVRGKDRVLVFLLPPVIVLHVTAQLAGYAVGRVKRVGRT